MGVQLLMPSPVYPSQHSQAKLPFVSMQAAFGAQLSVPRRHSLMLMVQSGPSILQAAWARLLRDADKQAVHCVSCGCG